MVAPPPKARPAGSDPPPQAADPEAAAVGAGADRALWPLALLFFASGLTALVYQVAWTRGFGLVFGSTTRAASVVLAAFFGGMALGNLWGGRRERGAAASLRAYGAVELAVAAGAVCVLVWLALYRELYPVLYRSLPGGLAGLTGLQLALAALALAPPCIGMGATLPLMARAVVTREHHLGRRVAAFYALNTAGATAGVLLSGFLLPVWIGTRGTVWLGAAGNLLLGLAALALARSWQRDEPARASPAVEPAARARSAGPGAAAIFAAAASGFGTLTLEVLYTRLIVNTMDTSVYGFAIMLATFLVSLALGSALVSAVVDRLRTPWSLVAWASALGALMVMISPSLFRWGSVVMPRPETGGLGAYLAWLLGFGLLVMGPGAIAIGVVLPAVWRAATQRVSEAGQRIGLLTGVNTLAAVVGSLAAGFVVIPAFGIGGGIAAVALLYGGLAIVAWSRSRSARWPWGESAVLVTALAGLFLHGSWQVLPVDLAEGEQLIFYQEARSGNVAVTQQAGHRLLRLDNGYVLGSSRPRGIRIHRSQGQLGLLLHRSPQSAAFIGIATGLSLSSILDFPTIERVLGMEIVPGVLAASPAFEAANRGVLSDPRVEVLLADGRNHLYGTEQRFDVVVSDLFIPWQAGTGYLYTAEHFRIVAERLEPGGLFVLWLQLNQFSQSELRTVLGTFSDVFPDSELWLNSIQAQRPLLGVVGHEGRPAPDSLRERRARVFRELPGLRFLCEAGPLRAWAGDAPRNTDDHPVIEFSAAASHMARPRNHLRDTVRSLQAQCDR